MSKVILHDMFEENRISRNSLVRSSLQGQTLKETTAVATESGKVFPLKDAETE